MLVAGSSRIGMGDQAKLKKIIESHKAARNKTQLSDFRLAYMY